MENQIDEMLEYFEEDIYDDHFENYRKNIITYFTNMTMREQILAPSLSLHLISKISQHLFQ